MFLKKQKRIVALEVIAEAITFGKSKEFVEGLATMAWELGLVGDKELAEVIENLKTKDTEK